MSKFKKKMSPALRGNHPYGFTIILLLALHATGCVAGIESKPVRVEEPENVMVYRVTLHENQPGTFHVRLRLPEPAARSDRIDLRNIPDRNVRRERILRVRCNGIPLQADERGGWKYPTGCKTLDWTVKSIAVTPSGIDISKQHALYSEQGPWWLISGPALLMRPQDSFGESSHRAYLEVDLPNGIKILNLQAEVSENRFLLPALQSPPVFMVAGNPEVIEAVEAGLRIRYFTDGGDGFDPETIMKAHARGIVYINSLVEGKSVLPEKEGSLDVVWIGVAQPHGIIGGAAGHGILLVNYLSGSDNQGPAFTRLPLMVLFHEQLHSLFDGLPVWMTESLAQYYAFKTLETTGLMDEPTREFAYERFAVRAEGAPKLLDVYRDFLNNKNQKLYGLFYTQGSAFWRAVDLTVTKHSKGEQSLDHLLTELLSIQYNAEGDLPPEFIQILIKAGGQEIALIVSEYLGK